MLIGSLLMEDSVSYSSWMPRIADNAIFGYEVVKYYGADSNPFTVKIFHKNAEDMGPGTEASSSWSTTGNTHKATVTDLMEMVRYQIECPTGDVGGVYRIFEPTWFDTGS